MFLEKAAEILSCDPDIHIVVDLYGNADSVAFADAEAARQNDTILSPFSAIAFCKSVTICSEPFRWQEEPTQIWTIIVVHLYFDFVFCSAVLRRKGQ